MLLLTLFWRLFDITNMIVSGKSPDLSLNKPNFSVKGALVIRLLVPFSP